MSYSTQFHDQLMSFLRQYSRYRDLRHIKALAWMVSALICSGKLSQPAWEPYVPSRAKLAQSFERRWQRFLSNTLICVNSRLFSPSITRLKRLAVPPSISCPRYHSLMESLLYDSSIGGLLWSRRTISMAGTGTQQRGRSLRYISTLVTSKPVAITSTS
ncbi:hypothetical protein [Moorena sp. SIO3H5]|uniref:hypothetical protein n=1 Tax=Moorena sp. SIO3H5 TaxID=2607834 RepID=UPI0025CB82F0|nr:hypothetical protein [Moorena sp. SIO3H5]